MNLLEKLRRRSNHEKNVIALVVAFVITFFIFLFWIYNVGFGINNKTQNNMELKDVSPLSFFEDNFKSVKSSIQQFPQVIDEMTKSVATSSNNSVSTSSEDVTSSTTIESND